MAGLSSNTNGAHLALIVRGRRRWGHMAPGHAVHARAREQATTTGKGVGGHGRQAADREENICP
eukprot:4266959-Pyramimonas_sp.AAC.1